MNLRNGYSRPLYCVVWNADRNQLMMGTVVVDERNEEGKGLEWVHHTDDETTEHYEGQASGTGNWKKLVIKRVLQSTPSLLGLPRTGYRLL